MTKEQRKIQERITRGVQTAVARALERHKMLGESIAIWKNGRVVVLPPDRIPLNKKKRRR